MKCARRPAVELSAKEFALLAYFVAHRWKLSRDRLLDAVWGEIIQTRTVDTYIVHLR
jgi:DNA-binding response OmpR family regulator